MSSLTDELRKSGHSALLTKMANEMSRALREAIDGGVDPEVVINVLAGVLIAECRHHIGSHHLPLLSEAMKQGAMMPMPEALSEKKSQ